MLPCILVNKNTFAPQKHCNEKTQTQRDFGPVWSHGRRREALQRSTTWSSAKNCVKASRGFL